MNKGVSLLDRMPRDDSNRLVKLLERGCWLAGEPLPNFHMSLTGNLSCSESHAYFRTMTARRPGPAEGNVPVGDLPICLDFFGPSLRPASVEHARSFLAPVAVWIDGGSFEILKTSESFGYDWIFSPGALMRPLDTESFQEFIDANFSVTRMIAYPARSSP